MSLENKVGSILAGVIATPMLLVACGHSPDSVVAVTGTVIGVEIGENPANQTFQGKLGYNRSEVAVVPTNKCHDSTGTTQQPGDGQGDANKEGNGTGEGGPVGTGKAGCRTTGNGAADTADVLMELHYKGIFNKDGGIYQRLAVGKNAVSATPTALMFATPLGASPTPAEQAQLVQAVRAQAATENEKVGYIVKCYTDTAGTGIDHNKLDTVLKDLSIPDADKKNLKEGAATPDELNEALTEESDNAISPLYEALPPGCKP